MNDHSSDTELLIQYLDGELSGEQLENILYRLRDHADLRTELENLQLAREGMKSYGLKSRIGDIHKEMMQELKSKETPKQSMVRTIFQTSVRVAAILILLVGASALYQYLTVTPDKLFKESFIAYQTHGLRDGSNPSALKSAYVKGETDSVIVEFNSGKSLEPEEYLMAGIAFMETNQPAKAIHTFDLMIQKNLFSKTDYFEDDAEYYLAMAYLENNESEKAIPIFKKIQADRKHAYNSKVSGWFLMKLKALHKK